MMISRKTSGQPIKSVEKQAFQTLKGRLSQEFPISVTLEEGNLDSESGVNIYRAKSVKRSMKEYEIKYLNEIPTFNTVKKELKGLPGLG